MDARPLAPGEVEAALALIARHQRRPATAVATVGVERRGIEAELEALVPAWTSTARVLGPIGAPPTGVAAVDWDVAVGRAWVHGPWVDGADVGAALALFDAVVAGVPVGVDEVELTGDVANGLVARVAAARGLAAGVVNHALVADPATVSSWDVATTGLRAGVAADVEAVADLHEAEFPSTYLLPSQLVGPARIFLVAPGDGYASGEVHADGEGFIDFVAVSPAARRRGVGRALVASMGRVLLAAGAQRVALSVQEHRRPARALYASMGFRLDASLVGYRGPIRRPRAQSTTSTTPSMP